jgi:hypothetical protein
LRIAGGDSRAKLRWCESTIVRFDQSQLPPMHRMVMSNLNCTTGLKLLICRSGITAVATWLSHTALMKQSEDLGLLMDSVDRKTKQLRHRVKMDCYEMTLAWVSSKQKDLAIWSRPVVGCIYDRRMSSRLTKGDVKVRRNIAY